MIGIVLVSHSAALAEGLSDLVGQVSGQDVRVRPAGGSGDGGLGTDPDRIAAAIRAADTGSGVVVLVDIGSAVLSVKAILAGGDVDGIDVRLADAPLVEGAVAASVLAATGADLAAVVAAAEEARDVAKL
ncbi:MAG TPA: dihydroxyacetone kinase phosphoryl donor subunit DhaM [Gaiellales bacterium]|nr:dihydroxyacetone kinase phosphoryl donor subunit DhaM [Gaiellales bacterium]